VPAVDRPKHTVQLMSLPGLKILLPSSTSSVNFVRDGIALVNIEYVVCLASHEGNDLLWRDVKVPTKVMH
jgi:hypothetical protein